MSNVERQSMMRRKTQPISKKILMTPTVKSNKTYTHIYSKNNNLSSLLDNLMSTLKLSSGGKFVNTDCKTCDIEQSTKTKEPRKKRNKRKKGRKYSSRNYQVSGSGRDSDVHSSGSDSDGHSSSSSSSSESDSDGHSSSEEDEEEEEEKKDIKKGGQNTYEQNTYEQDVHRIVEELYDDDVDSLIVESPANTDLGIYNVENSLPIYEIQQPIISVDDGSMDVVERVDDDDLFDEDNDDTSLIVFTDIEQNSNIGTEPRNPEKKVIQTRGAGYVAKKGKKEYKNITHSDVFDIVKKYTKTIKRQ
jgi:hypothetical protein